MTDLERMSDAQLMREYQEMRKAGFNQMFGHNARQRCNACADELLKRGVTEEPNIFGPMAIQKWTY